MKKKHWFVKRWFIQGVAVTLPVIITGILLYYGMIYGDAILWFLWDLLPITASKPNFPGLGLVFVTVTTILIGAAAESWVISKCIKLFNYTVSKLPIIRSIYSTVLKVVDSAFGKNGAFSKTVLVQYPMKGNYAIAFLTNQASQEIQRKTGKELVCVFLPTTPSPTSGFFLLVPKDEIIELDMDAEQAFKLIISAGVVQD